MGETRAALLTRSRPRALSSRHVIESLEGRTLFAVAADQLAAWFRADTLGLSAGSTVVTWPDSSGHGYDATQADAVRRPRFVPAGLDSRPAVRFDADDST